MPSAKSLRGVSQTARANDKAISALVARYKIISFAGFFFRKPCRDKKKTGLLFYNHSMFL
jgi:hypothetical protein